MYPDWPESAAGFVPLPQCNGPKLKPFAFGVQQKIEFVKHSGEGQHAHVFKVRMLEQIYALKLFRFVYDNDWLGPPKDVDDPDDLQMMTAFYNYSEPFSCECRAFGRLHEAGYNELAIGCFGYLLLDEEHERIMMDQFSHLHLDFNGNGDYPGYYDMRSRFLGKDGKPPPIRAIVKAFGQGDEVLRTNGVRKILQDVIQLQQLGIIHIDVAHRPLINGKISDSSTAITVPHFCTSPELNLHLMAESISAMDFETFKFSISDYWDFDEMVREWNEEHEHSKDKISVHAFPGGRGCGTKYSLRSMPSRERPYSLVDPRLWRSYVAGTENGAMGENTGRDVGRAVNVQKSSHKKNDNDGKLTRGDIPKIRRRLDTKPRRWYYDCDSKVAIQLKGRARFETPLKWNFKDGLLFPRRKK